MHPLIVKHLILPTHERLLGRDTLIHLRSLESSQWWTVQRLRELQQAKLRTLLKHTHAQCPFYRRRIDGAGIDPERATLAELSSLPTLTKTDIAGHMHEMIDPTVRGGLHPFSTGGSTGAPLTFKVDRFRQAADQAARARSRRWFGIDIGCRELYLWGSPLEQAAQDRLKRFRDALANHRLLDAFNMTPRTMTRYIDAIHRFDPVHLFGYPSSLARLARHAAETGRRIQNRSLKAVFVTGELFTPADRAVIEEAVSVPVADGYGSREGGFIAHQCPKGAYHVTMESMIVELLDENDSAAGIGHSGEVTLTHLDAFGMPFIRYRTGDMARRAGVPTGMNGEPPSAGRPSACTGPTRPGSDQQLAIPNRLHPSSFILHPSAHLDEPRCPCGRGLETLEIIDGRRTDMLRRADGGYAHALSAIYVLREEPAISRFKVVQQPDLDLDVYIVPRDPDGRLLDRARQKHIRRQLRRRIGGRIDVRITLVDEIPPDPSGKHRQVVSLVP